MGTIIRANEDGSVETISDELLALLALVNETTAQIGKSCTESLQDMGMAHRDLYVMDVETALYVAEAFLCEVVFNKTKEF